MLLEALDLSGKGIGLTGGGGYLGSALALGLAEAGATVVICGRTPGPLRAVVDAASASPLKGCVLAEVADARTDEGVAVVMNRLEREAGSVSGWVNNAFSGQAGRALDSSESEVADILASGLTSVIMATQTVSARMAETGGGAIVNISSMYGMVSPRPEIYANNEEFHSPSAYGAAKAGVLQFTRYAACHLGRSGVRVNAVSPGPFPKPSVLANKSFVSALEHAVPLGRLGKPNELVGPVVFLLSEAASYVTGHNLVVDGGWTAW